MDWVDYKRYVIRYRPPYTDGYRHISVLYGNAVYFYSKYRSSSIECDSESVYIDHFSRFLYHLAELENMLVDAPTEKFSYDDNEWGMVTESIRILKGYYNGEVSNLALLVSCKSWVRNYYPIAYTSRIFNSGMVNSVKLLQHKFGY